MVVSTEHTAVSTPAALELDRMVRYQLLDALLRPAQVRNFRDQLGHTIAAADVQNPVGGRLRFFKRIFAKFLRPFQAQQASFNRLVTDRLAELYDFMVTLTNAKADLLEALSAEQREQLEKLRTELFLEVRALAPSQAVAEDLRACVTLRSLGSSPRLCLGAQGAKRPGYLTIDVVPGPGVDLVAPLDQLPARPGTVAEIVADHVLERYAPAEVARRLLPHWAALLGDSGKLVIVTGDLEAAAESLQTGALSLAEFTRFLFGPQARPTDSYRSAYTPALLKELLGACGLTGIKVTGRRRVAEGAAFELTLEAHRAAAARAA